MFPFCFLLPNRLPANTVGGEDSSYRCGGADIPFGGALSCTMGMLDVAVIKQRVGLGEELLLHGVHKVVVRALLIFRSRLEYNTECITWDA